MKTEMESICDRTIGNCITLSSLYGASHWYCQKKKGKVKRETSQHVM